VFHPCFIRGPTVSDLASAQWNCGSCLTSGLKARREKKVRRDRMIGGIGAIAPCGSDGQIEFDQALGTSRHICSHVLRTANMSSISGRIGPPSGIRNRRRFTGRGSPGARWVGARSFTGRGSPGTRRVRVATVTARLSATRWPSRAQFGMGRDSEVIVGYGDRGWSLPQNAPLCAIMRHITDD